MMFPGHRVCRGENARGENDARETRLERGRYLSLGEVLDHH